MKDIISARRKELGLTQQQLAEKLNVSDKVVSKWETGRSLPDTSLLLQLADALSLSVDDLLHTGETNQSAVRQAAMREANSKFKNLFIITTALQSIAMILLAAGRLIRKGRGNNILSPDGARRIDRNRGGQLLSGDAESFVDPLSGKRRFRSKICRTVIMRHVFLIVYTGGRICSDTRTDFRGTADCVTHLRPGSADPVRSMLYSEQKK